MTNQPILKTGKNTHVTCLFVSNDGDGILCSVVWLENLNIMSIVLLVHFGNGKGL